MDPRSALWPAHCYDAVHKPHDAGGESDFGNAGLEPRLAYLAPSRAFDAAGLEHRAAADDATGQ